jgi:D-alanine-D-alanine ligase
MVVVYGGPSAEHDISCISALRIARAARRNGRAVHAIGLTRDKRWVDANSELPNLDDLAELTSPDVLLAEAPARQLPHLADALPEHPVVFPALHGPFGEDGVIQGYFEGLGVPYVGAGVLASAICMDKLVSKQLLDHAGIPVAKWDGIGRATRPRAAACAETHGYPCFVKPANLGSSIGVSKAHNADELEAAVALALEFDDHVVIEEFVAGRELELAVLGNEQPRVSGAGEILASKEFYDYEDKYLLGVAKTIVPMELSDDLLRAAQQLALDAFGVLRVEGLARVDLFLRPNGEFVVNEVNTMPGFTTISMYPMLWEAAGLPFGDLVEELLELGIARHEHRRTFRVYR